MNIHLFWIKKRRQWKNYEETMTNCEEHVETLNMDLRSRKVRTYSYRSSAEVAAVSLNQLGLMQRPRLTETEVERSGGEARAVAGSREEEDGKREKNEEGRGEPIYKGKGEQTGAKIKEEPNKWLSSYTGASILGKH